jgi:cytochrome oxidase Cu insertion factor (SCO1/SenC/PrrC family)
MMKRLSMVLLLCAAGCGEPIGTDAGTDKETEARCGDGAEVGLEVGMCAPEFTLPDSEGEMTSLSSFRGKVALVDISALW